LRKGPGDETPKREFRNQKLDQGEKSGYWGQPKQGGRDDEGGR